MHINLTWTWSVITNQFALRHIGHSISPTPLVHHSCIQSFFSYFPFIYNVGFFHFPFFYSFLLRFILSCFLFSLMFGPRNNLFFFHVIVSYISRNYTNKSFENLRNILRNICKGGYSWKFMHKTSLILRGIGICLKQPICK